MLLWGSISHIVYEHITEILLTHWGRVTHICVGKLIIIGSENVLSPRRRNARASKHFPRTCPMNTLVVVVCRVYALSMAALSRRSRWVTVCSRRLIVSATWVTCSVLVVAAWLLPLLDAGVPGVSSEKTFLCSHPSLCLSTWGVVCLALMYVVQCYMVRKLGPWLPPPFTDCAVTIVLWSAGSVGSNRRMTHQWTNCMPN